MRWIFKTALAIDSIAIMLVIYFVKEQIWIGKLGIYSIGLYLLAVYALGGICLFLTKFLSSDSIEGGLQGIELANDSFLPSYLGYFFVTLSVPNLMTLSMVFGVLFVFLLCSQNLYYNPVFLLYGYKFYYVTNADGMKIFVITRKTIKSTRELEFTNLGRINYFTFIDRSKKE